MAEHNATTQIVGDTISNAMKHAIGGISVFFVTGFLASLFTATGESLLELK